LMARNSNGFRQCRHPQSCSFGCVVMVYSPTSLGEKVCRHSAVQKKLLDLPKKNSRSAVMKILQRQTTPLPATSRVVVDAHHNNSFSTASNATTAYNLRHAKLKSFVVLNYTVLLFTPSHPHKTTLQPVEGGHEGAREKCFP
jgi:hypothetical protein